MIEKEFLKNFKEHLKIAFSYRSRKKYRCWSENKENLLGKEGIERVRQIIIQNIIYGFCPFGFFTTYLHRRTDVWRRQVEFYQEYKYHRGLHHNMIEIIKKYQPVWRKKK